MNKLSKNCTVAINAGVIKYGNQAAVAVRKGHMILFKDILSKTLNNGICDSNGEIVTLTDMVNVSSTSTTYNSSFQAADWEAGVPQTLTITAENHGLPVPTETPVIYHITVLDEFGNQADLIGFNTNQANGNVIIQAASGFNGFIKINY